jgi:hypothetical protein
MPFATLCQQCQHYIRCNVLSNTAADFAVKHWKYVHVSMSEDSRMPALQFCKTRMTALRSRLDHNLRLRRQQSSSYCELLTIQQMQMCQKVAVPITVV